MARQEKNLMIRRLCMIIAFYGINFGIWEVLVEFIPQEWASFGVYLILFPVTFILLWKQIKEEWKGFIASTKGNKRFVTELLVFLIIYFVLGAIVLFVASYFGLDILPKNNENVSTQLHTIPVYLTFIQTCIFAPVIEEMTFRYSIIGKVNKENKMLLILSCVISVILFDAIHIFTFGEFFYYLAPAIVLTGFYVRRKSVIASMILHSLVNIIGTVVLLFQ